MGDVERVRFGRLKLMALSAAHYRANPQGESTAMSLGTAVHSELLGGRRITFYPEVTASGRSAPRNGSKWDQFKADNADALVLSRAEYDEASRMVEAVRRHPEAMQLLDAPGAIKEKTIEFDYMGLPCRTTPDSRNSGIVVELKTCRSSMPRRFASQSFWSSYHAQCAFHRLGCDRSGEGKKRPYIVAVESTAPYPVTVFRVTDRAIESGMASLSLWLEQLKVCLDSDQWPAYTQSVIDLDVPEDEFGGSEEEAA
jgi:hypothetical protein